MILQLARFIRIGGIASLVEGEDHTMWSKLHVNEPFSMPLIAFSLAVPALGAGYAHTSGVQHMSRYIAPAGLCIALVSASSAFADPRCDEPENWPAAMTHAQLKNDGVLVNEEVDFSRTAVQQIASQRIGKDLYRQVFKIVFHLKKGRLVQAIAVSDASKEECSMSDVTVYRIAGPAPE